MISIYDFNNYREYLSAWIENNGSRGIRGQMAKAMNISSTMMSLILKGDKNLALEQASDLADFLRLNENESDYLFLLVEIGKSGSHRLTSKLTKKLKAQQTQAKKISHRIKKDLELSNETKSIFYSSWLYSGARNLAAIPKYSDTKSIAEHLNVHPGVAQRIIDFLIENNLCKVENGKITYGVARTHIDFDSPFVNKHHQNWRFRSINKMEEKNDQHLFFTSPMSLSKQAAEEIRVLLPKLIEQIMKISGPSDSEVAYCLNLDWFEY